MNARVISFAAALTFSSAACASTPEAPMHVYNSAFLESDGMVDAKPKNSEFDPLRTGDFSNVADVYVVRNDGRWAGSPAASESGNDAGIPKTVEADKTPQVADSDSVETPDTVEETQDSKVSKPSLSTAAPSAVGGKEEVASERNNERREVESNGYVPAQAAEFVSAVYQMNGVKIPATVPADIYKSCKSNGAVYFGTKPKVGDVVFFHNTFDSNADGRNNDWYTHIGLVQSVADDATAEVVAWHDGSLKVHKINLERPEVAEDSGETLNSRLREPGNDDAPFTQYYSGQLFAGFCGLLGEKDQFVLVENWQPGMDLPTNQN